MQAKNYPVKEAKALASLKAAVDEYQGMNETLPIKSEQLLTDTIRIKALIDLTAHLVIGDNARTAACMREILNTKALAQAEIEHVMQHAAVYSGFPVGMNGRGALKQINS